MEGRKIVPNLYAVAASVFATPVSSAAIEIIFSVLKLVVDDKRSRLFSSLVGD